MGLDVLIDISREATLEASKALSKFVGAPVALGAILADITPVPQIPLDLKPSDPLYVVSGTITADATGQSLLMLPETTARDLSDLLFRRPSGTTETIGADEEDALQETANIVIGNYLRVFTRTARSATLVHRSMGIRKDVGAAVIQYLEDFCSKRPNHNTMVFRVAFNFRHATCGGWVVIILDATYVQRLLASVVAA